MALTQPQYQLGYARKELARCQEDIEHLEEWQQKHEALKTRCWPWEDGIAKMNFTIERLLNFDRKRQRAMLRKEVPFDSTIETEVNGLFREWYALAIRVLEHVARVEQEHGHLEGAELFRDYVNEARGILTPASEFFASDKLAELRDQAIDEHRAGHTTPLI